MKVNDINVTKQERLEPRKYYSEEQLIELFGIGGKKETPIKQSDVTRVLQNIQMRKAGTHPVRFKDGEVVEIDPKVAFRINNWMDKRPKSKEREDEKMVSSWEGFQKIAKLLGIEKMIPKPKMADDINRMLNLAGVEEAYYKLPDYDKDKYQQRDGLEGPIPTKTGKVLYYDPKEGMYYDPDTDMFITYDEFRKYDGYDESIEEYDAKGMNKYGISAVHKDGKFYAFRNGKMVGGPFDTIEQLADFQKKSIENESYSPWTSTNKHPETMSRSELEREIEIFKQQEKIHALDPGERAQLDSLYYYLENLKDGEYDDLHQEFDELVGMDEDADTMKPPVQYNFTKKDFLDNESENMHTENAVELATLFGTKEEQDRMNKIMTAHNTRGYILPDEQEERDQLVQKYYPMLEDVVAEEDNTYTVVHAKHGKEEIKAPSSYAAAKKYADMKKLKGTAGVDAHLHTKEDDPSPVASTNTVLDRLRLIVKDKQNAKVQLDDGHLTVDLYTASAITQVYDKVNDANKAKMEKMMNTKAGLVRLTDLVFSIMNKRKDEGINHSDAHRDAQQYSDGSMSVKDVMGKPSLIMKSYHKEKDGQDFAKKHGYKVSNYVKTQSGSRMDIEEAKLTKAQIKKRDKIADKMPDKEFKKRYGKDADAVKYGAATNMVKNDIHEGIIDEKLLEDYSNLIQKKLEMAEAYEQKIMDPETKQMIPEKDYVMKYVMAKHPEATKKLLQSEDLMDIYDDPLYQDLFDYFSEEMPYGTQKARDGDPVQYMQDELDMMGMFENNQVEGDQVTREEEQQLLNKVDEFKTKDQEKKDIEAKQKALDDIKTKQAKYVSQDPEAQKAIMKRQAELDRLKKLAGV